MRKSPKSQVTMMIIIGLLLFIVVSLVLYLSKYAVKKQSDRAIKSSQAIDVQPINSFVDQCLEKLSKDAVELIGKQGGYIYTSQGGSLADLGESDKGKFFIEYDDEGKKYDTAYNIFPLNFNVPINTPVYYSSSPDYPWKEFPYLAGTPVFIGIFGLDDDMPPLEKTQGSQSVQQQIETYIDNNMPACLDFSPFEEQGFEIESQPAKTSIIFGSKDVSINSKIPLTIKDTKTEESTELSDFSTVLDLRLRSIYLYARNLINSDVTNIKFNIGGFSNGDNSFEVDLLKDVFEKDDIIKIKDKKSLVYGKPFEYVFARKNRAPALHHMTENVEADSETIVDKAKLLELLGISDFEADDPDEDSNLIFTVNPQSVTLNQPTDFTIEVSDGNLKDYQTIRVNVES